MVWGPKAEIFEKHVEKGDLLWVRGELRLNSYTDKDGTNWKISEIILEQFKFLSAKKGKANEEAAAAGQTDEEPAEGDIDFAA